jgi:hypothetical protein
MKPTMPQNYTYSSPCNLESSSLTSLLECGSKVSGEGNRQGQGNLQQRVIVIIGSALNVLDEDSGSEWDNDDDDLFDSHLKQLQRFQ